MELFVKIVTTDDHPDTYEERAKKIRTWLELGMSSPSEITIYIAEPIETKEMTT